MRAGVLVSGNNLVLQMVRRVSAGNYTCAATNTLTTTASNTVLLDIKCECSIFCPLFFLYKESTGQGQQKSIEVKKIPTTVPVPQIKS